MAEEAPLTPSSPAVAETPGRDGPMTSGDNGEAHRPDEGAIDSGFTPRILAPSVLFTPEALVSERVESLIEEIRTFVTKIVPAEETLNRLEKLRFYAAFRRQRRRFLSRIFPRLRVFYHDEQFETPLKERLGEIEKGLRSNSTEADLRETLLDLRALQVDADIKIRQLNSTFIALNNSLTTSGALVSDLVQKIGHRELRDEAKMHLGIVTQLVRRLELEAQKDEKRRSEWEGWEYGRGHIFSDEFVAATGIMIELEQRKVAVEELVHNDRKRRQWTVAIVIGYIALVLALAVVMGIRWKDRFFIGDGPLNNMRLPLVGIPWPVIVWSLIGSFAAMIYRFNKKPIYDFGDAVKWMLTRPVQGVVLGSAFYLVLISGLFLLGGTATAQSSPASTTNAVILILSFLVGFSDRFADSVFNAIVDKYSQSREFPADDLERSEDKVGADVVLPPTEPHKRKT